MFTGIIQDIGVIDSIDRMGDWTVAILTRLPLGSLRPGASMACSGICLTMTEIGEDYFTVQMSAETLGRTTASRWNVGTRLNLEPALRMGDELGGHLVAGHVDCLARVLDKRRDGDSMRYKLEVPPDHACYLAPKGSVALDGISLTLNEVEGTRFDVNIIPHTRLMTTIGERLPGDPVNFEVDMIARYVERIMRQGRELP
jgi:riboflavin synthase